MELRSVRHDKALRLAEQKILCSRLARYVKELYIYGSAARGAEKWNSDIDLLLVLDPEKKGNREIKREIIYLKGSITEEDIDAPEIDLKVVFGDISIAKELLSGKKGFICQYDRDTGKDTVWSVIYDLKHHKIYRAEGNPARCVYQEDQRVVFQPNKQ